MTGSKEGNDPRRTGTAEAFAPLADAADPVVGRIGTGPNMFVIVGVFAVLAVALFLLLDARRTQQAASLVTPVSREAVAPAPPLPIVAQPPAPPVIVIPPVPVMAAPSPPPPVDTSQNLRAPAVVVDLQTNGLSQNAAAPGAAAPQATTGASSRALAADAAEAASGGSFAANEQFATQASESLLQASVATQLTHLNATITQGATIPAILETAVNSDLPGYTRAVVSRDVRSFDGKAVLIPRGSRLIGQYRSALSLGQSRVFVIWTRVIRPDGVSVQIGSPGEDALGRGGLTGDVDSHFFARFGGAVLLSVLNTGVAAVGRTPSTQVVIGSSTAALGAAANAVVPTGENILPTIEVAQGTPITIFVARDLDFSVVKPVP